MEKIKKAIFEYTNLNIQIIKFLIVGGFTFIIDYISMVMLVEVFNINYLISTGVGFIIGSIINYILSAKVVFIGGKYNKLETEITVFMIFTVLGLVLNHLIMYMGCDYLKVDYRIIKIISLIFVTIFNFVTKKIFVFKK